MYHVTMGPMFHVQYVSLVLVEVSVEAVMCVAEKNYTAAVFYLHV